jgi:hypothetical protein
LQAEVPLQARKAFSSYLRLRTVSAVGDDIWHTCIPLFAAAAGWSSEDLGLVVSLSSAFALLAYVLAPIVFSRPISLAVFSSLIDLLQFVLFFVAGIALPLLDAHGTVWLVGVVACGSSLFAAFWYVANEALLPRIQDLGSAQEIQKQNFLSSTIGSTVGPAVAATCFKLIGLTPLLYANALSFLGQCYYLKKLASFEVAPKVQISKSHWTVFASIWAIFKWRFIVASSAFSMYMRVLTMGFVPFVVFRYEAAGTYSGLWIGGLVLAYPAAMLASVKLYPSKTKRNIRVGFSITSCAFVFSGFAVIWSTLTSQHPAVTIALLAAFGASIGVFTVQGRALRQTIVSHDDLPNVIASQSLWGRLVTPLSGIVFGLVLANKQYQDLALYSLVPLIVFGLVLVGFQIMTLRESKSA